MEVLLGFALLACCLAAALTVPTGFGLATMITPIFLLWFEPHHAIAGVAIVHGAHNGMKAFMLKSHIGREAIQRFGLMLIFGAGCGALLQSYIPSTPLLFLVGLTLVVLPLLTMSASWSDFRLPASYDQAGGFASGLLGGLTGHQGALRAMFLKQRVVEKTQYAATAATLALIVDMVRVPLYMWQDASILGAQPWLLLGFILAALFGARLGKTWLEQWKSDTIHHWILFCLVASGVLYMAEAVMAVSSP